MKIRKIRTKIKLSTKFGFDAVKNLRLNKNRKGWKSAKELKTQNSHSTLRDEKILNNTYFIKFDSAVVKKLIEQEKFDEAKKRCQNVLNINPNIRAAHQLLALAYQNLGKYDDAIDHYKISLKGAKNRSFIYNYIGTCYRAKEDFKKALNYHETAYQLDNKDIRAIHGLIVCFLKLHFYSNAKYYLDIANKITKNDREINLQYADYHACMEHWVKSFVYYNKAKINVPEEHKLTNFVIYCWRKLNETNKAKIEKLLTAAISFEHEKNYKLSIRFFNFAQAIKPFNIKILLSKGCFLLKTWELEEAKRCFDTVLSLATEDNKARRAANSGLMRVLERFEWIEKSDT